MKTSKLMMAMMAAASMVLSTSCNDDDKNENDEKETTYSYATPEAVDLGLSVKWASCNLGAKAPEEDGYFYAWGQTTPSSKYDLNGYEFYDKEKEEYTKYNDKDGLTTLELDDDAAAANLGGKWRMPSYAEILELVNNTEAEWTTVSGAKGYKFTAKNGNSIFIPAAGFKNEKGQLCNSWKNDESAKGCYWSNTLMPGNEEQAKDLFIFSGYTNGNDDQWYRYAAQMIRPVSD